MGILLCDIKRPGSWSYVWSLYVTYYVLDIGGGGDDDDNDGDDNIGSRSVHPWLAVKCEIDTLSALSTDPMLIILIITRTATTLSPQSTLYLLSIIIGNCIELNVLSFVVTQAFATESSS